MDIVLVYESLRHLNQRYRSMQPAIIPPIRLERGNVIFVAGVIHRSHDKVRACVHLLCYLAVKRGVAALVLANLLAVDPEPRTIVSRAYVEKHSCVLLRLVGEVALIPDGP